MTGLNSFPPLQAAIAHAESWRSYLTAFQQDLRSPHTPDIIARAEDSVNIGIQLGELLPLTWRAAFHGLFRPCWQSAKEFEAVRQQIRALFFTAREAMDDAREIADMLQALTSRQPAGMDRLHKVIEEARQLEESVFRDWPSFAEPCLPADSLPVDESLAESLGISVEEARQKMDARRHQLNVQPE